MVKTALDALQRLLDGPVKAPEAFHYPAAATAFDKLHQCGYASEVNGYYLLSVNGLIVAINLGMLDNTR